MSVMALLFFAFGVNAAPLSPMKTSTALLTDLHAQVLRLGTEFEKEGEVSISMDDKRYRSAMFMVTLKNERISLRAEYDEDSVLTHLGVMVCDSSLFRAENIIAKFLERELLSVLLCIPTEASLKLTADNVSLVYNHTENRAPTLAFLKPFLNLHSSARAFRLVKDPKKSVARWIDAANNTYEIIFPLRYDLLMGMDKKELDERTERELKKCSLNAPPNRTYGQADISSMVKYNGSLFLKKGKEYQKGLSTDCYYHREGNTYSFVFDAKYPQETIRSMFLMPYGKDTAIQFSVTHVEYGNREERYPVSLSALKSFLADYTPFVGFESRYNDTITATVLFVHKEFNNAFLFFFSVPAASFSTVLWQQAPIHASLISNIRTDNIQSVFGHYSEGSKKIDFKLKQ